ncbi:MAG TPA: LysR family transcriptional regulator [Elusimicrobiota bacterium]|nr:LysR family transcriptional regulator [Elusimicrobiota bacterium]
MPLDLNYHHLYYFWVCVRAGSLTAASRELHLSQSALSLQLKSLERSVGRRLLDRSRSGVLPTADGRLVFERCERIFPEGEALSAALRSGEKRAPVEFRIGVASGLGREVVLAVLDRISGIQRLTPRVVVSPGAAIQEGLIRRRHDAGIFSGDVSAEIGPAFRTRRLDALPLRFVATPALAASLGPFPRRGREYPMLLRPSDHPIRVKVEAWLSERGARSQTVAETADVDLLRALALQGRGIAVVHSAVVKEDLAAGRLVRLAGSPLDLMHEIWFAAPVRPAADEPIRAALAAILRPGAIFGKAAAAGRRGRA